MYSLNSKVEKKVPMLIAIGIFIPSFFLWTSLGLRESIFFLLVSLIFFALFEIELRNKRLQLIILIPFFCFIYLTKPHIYLILVLSITISFFIITLKEQKVCAKNIIVLISSIVPLALLFNSTLTQVDVIEKQFDNYKGTQIHNNTDQNESKKFTNYNIGNNNSITETEILLDRQKNVSLIYRLLFNSSIFKSTQNNKDYSPASITNPLSLVKSSLTFVLFPIPFRDNGSIMLNVISLEFFMWAFIYFKLILYLVSLKKNFRNLSFTQTTLMIFILIFILISALIEVNLGTSLRHRSLLLILVLILLSSNYSNETKSYKSY
jgi:hypothetical protein